MKIPYLIFTTFVVVLTANVSLDNAIAWGDSWAAIGGSTADAQGTSVSNWQTGGSAIGNTEEVKLHTMSSATIQNIPLTQTFYGGCSLSEYEGFSNLKNTEAKAMLESFFASLLLHQSSFPSYKDGEQQCIQDYETAKANWTADLKKYDPQHVSWADNMHLVTSDTEWHAMTAISPNGQFSNPSQVYIVDARDISYRGTVTDYNGDDNDILKIYSTYSMRYGKDYENGKLVSGEEATTLIDGTPSQTFAAGAKPDRIIDNTVENMINHRSEVIHDNLTGLPINTQKTYYESKIDPNIFYSQESYDLRLSTTERSRLITIEPK
ncbi:MAG: hypothetical protein WBE75_03650 [Candidatus Omnitrophota bacterium]